MPRTVAFGAMASFAMRRATTISPPVVPPRRRDHQDQPGSLRAGIYGGTRRRWATRPEPEAPAIARGGRVVTPEHRIAGASRSITRKRNARPRCTAAPTISATKSGGDPLVAIDGSSRWRLSAAAFASCTDNSVVTRAGQGMICAGDLVPTRSANERDARQHVSRSATGYRRPATAACRADRRARPGPC
jgi:hypothetical protein